MSNFKRKKTKRSVRCTLCTTHRWNGNSKNRFKGTDREKAERMKKEAENAREPE